MSDDKKTRRGNGEGSLITYRDAHNRVRYRIGLTPPPPLKGRQKWFTLPPETQQSKAAHTFEAWVVDVKVNPREYFPELFEGQNAPAGESLEDWFDRWFKDRDVRDIQTKTDR